MKNQTGKRLQRDRQRTSDAILKTATALFLERGYAAVPLSAIAKQAQVTKSLIHHYFGDKRGLWRAVRDASVASYANQQRAIFSADRVGKVEGVAASVSLYFSFFQKQPEIARLFALECFDGEFEPGTIERELQAEGLDFIEGLQRAGALREDIEADMMQVVFIALIEHWFLSRERVAKLNAEQVGAKLDARYLNAITKVLSSGLQPSST